MDIGNAPSVADLHEIQSDERGDNADDHAYRCRGVVPRRPVGRDKGKTKAAIILAVAKRVFIKPSDASRWDLFVSPDQAEQFRREELRSYLSQWIRPVFLAVVPVQVFNKRLASRQAFVTDRRQGVRRQKTGRNGETIIQGRVFCIGGAALPWRDPGIMSL